jgi:hypothetical protein
MYRLKDVVIGSDIVAGTDYIQLIFSDKAFDNELASYSITTNVGACTVHVFQIGYRMLLVPTTTITAGTMDIEISGIPNP